MIIPARKKAKRLVVVSSLLILYLLRLNIDISEDIDTDAIWRVLDQPENQDHVLCQPRSWYKGYDLGE